jgi:translation elongation factor EF-G
MYKITNKMDDILNKSIEYITKKQYDKAEEAFNKFVDLYEKNRAIFSVFINDNHVKSINISIEKITNTFKSEFEESLLTEFEELTENINHIYNDYNITIENIL